MAASGNVADNAGQVTVSQYGWLTAGGSVTVSGTTLVLQGGTVQTGSGLIIESGATLSVVNPNGLVRGDLVNDGIITVTGSTLTVTGNYTQGGSGMLNLFIADPGWTMLVVDGAANLGGTLNVAWVSGSDMTYQGPYNLIDYGSLNGPFATVNLPPVNSPGTWDFQYGYPDNTISLSFNWNEPGGPPG